MKIEVFGPGCAKCEALHQRVKEIAAKLQLDCEIVKITDITEIVSRGIIMTPAVLVDGEVKSAGKVPTEEQLEDLLEP
jgi:small redox-active disulfide protein 2